MNELLDPNIQNYINANLQADLHSLLLRKSPFEKVTMQEIVQQIRGRHVAQKKFRFLQKKNIIFPPNLNLEQASSQATAEFKGRNLVGKSFLDLTCGFGIDAFFLSQNFDTVALVERNEQLLNIVRHNWNVLDRKACFYNEELDVFLANNTANFDVIYLDPARRDQQLKKKFLLEDLSPNLLDIQEQLLKIGRKVIVKLSPLIDISYLMTVLHCVSEIQVIAVKNEVKELLVIMDAKFLVSESVCTCVNLESIEPIFRFNLTEEKETKADYSDVLKYLYIPNNAILKSGAFNSIAKAFQVSKLHPNTHFYTSNFLIEDFPGRILQVEKIDAKAIDKNSRFNIMSKNHPLSPEEIKKKYKVKDGGVHYLIFTQTLDSKIILRSVDREN